MESDGTFKATSVAMYVANGMTLGILPIILHAQTHGIPAIIQPDPDLTDLLEIVHKHGFRAIRSWGRDEKDCQPTPLELKPFFYEAQGFPDILECFLHLLYSDVARAGVRPAHAVPGTS